MTSNLVVATNRVILYYWDPQGTNGPNPYTNSMSGAWESDSWSANMNGRIVPVGWYEGQAAVVGVNTGPGTPPFTITMNKNHTVAGHIQCPQTQELLCSPVAINGSLAL